MTKVFFATDIHGSDICWKKFINAGKFYGAEVIVLGGDMTGKAIVPIVRQDDGSHQASLLEQPFELRSEEELQDFEKRVRSRGYYPYRTNPEEIEELSQHPEMVEDVFRSEVVKTLEQWVDYAESKLKESDVRCYVCPGNDDIPLVDEMIRSSKRIHLTEGEVIDLDRHHQMISSGWSNITPWHTYREESEEALQMRYSSMIAGLREPRLSVFNIHVPPYGSMLDDAPELDEDLRPKFAGNAVHPVGSRSLRHAIEIHQPLLGLHGHIHESRGATRIGHTLCINPGSMYEQGSLLGALIQIAQGKIENYVLTSG